MKANNHKKLSEAYDTFLESQNEYAKAFRINPESYETHMWEDFLLLSEKTFHEMMEAPLPERIKSALCDAYKRWRSRLTIIVPHHHNRERERNVAD